MLAFGGEYTGYGSKGIGLRGYSPDGAERFHALGNEWIGWVETAWPYVYVRSEEDWTVAILDLRTGRRVNTVTLDESVSVLGR